MSFVSNTLPPVLNTLHPVLRYRPLVQGVECLILFVRLQGGHALHSVYWCPLDLCNMEALLVQEGLF